MEKHFYKTLIDYDLTKPAALCSLVNFKGSVPRKDYPQMLVRLDGKTFGTVGGGNLEHSVIQSAKITITESKPQLLHFEMTGDRPESSGGICGGTGTVLVEPFSPAIQDQFRKLDWTGNFKDSHTILTHFDPVNLTVKRIWDWELPNDRINTVMLNDAAEGELKFPALKGRWFRQVISPPTVLHIFGAGHVGQSVAELAHFLDLDVMIYDDRAEMASEQRFPFALGRTVNSYALLVERFQPAPSDFVLVMTKGHQHDFELIQRLLKLEIRYLGLMASQRKWSVLRKALVESGFTDEQLNRVHAPIGLNIGGETVPEIALSILAEVVNQLRRGGRSPIALSNPLK